MCSSQKIKAVVGRYTLQQQISLYLMFFIRGLEHFTEEIRQARKRITSKDDVFTVEQMIAKYSRKGKN